MKAELNIDTSELEERIVRRVMQALRPFLKEKREGSSFFNVKDLAEYLKVSEKWVYERVQFSEIPYYKVGGNLRFKRSEIEYWLEKDCKTPTASSLSSSLKVMNCRPGRQGD